jgi:hypothetical protein
VASVETRFANSARVSPWATLSVSVLVPVHTAAAGFNLVLESAGRPAIRGGGRVGVFMIHVGPLQTARTTLGPERAAACRFVRGECRIL